MSLARTQDAQKCPVCHEYLFGRDQVVEYGSWLVHAECESGLQKTPQHQPVVVNEAVATFADRHGLTAKTLFSFEEPGVCRCWTPVMLNSAGLCWSCFSRYVSAATPEGNP